MKAKTTKWSNNRMVQNALQASNAIPATAAGLTQSVTSKASCVYSRVVKRVLDIIISFVLLPFLFLAFILVAPIIWYCDRGSTFYNAPRLGYKGKPFIMYKFRSMKVDSADIRLDDGSTYNGENDTRQTKIGRFLRKTSLDEMPQIINVFKGDMSLVGPRPDLPEHINQYEGNEIEKLNVKPGMTGYNQAYFRNTVEWKERLKNDVFYSRNISPLFDIKILFRTACVVLLRQNIYVNDGER